MTTEILQEFSRLCDEVEGFMQRENSELRTGHTDGSEWVDDKRSLMERFDHLLALLRQEKSRTEAGTAAAQALRDTVMKKLLKLMLLSRESEQLLLKNTLPQRPVMSRVAVTAQTLQRAYKPAASAALAAAV